MASAIGDIIDFLPIKEIKDGLITFTTNTYGKIMKVGSVNLAYLSLEEQRFKISQLAGLLRNIDSACSIFKLERPMEITDNIRKQDRLMDLQHDKFRNNDMNEVGYKERVKQVLYEKNLLQDYNEKNPIMINEFYFIIYGKNIDSLEHEYENALMRFNQLKLDPERCTDSQIKMFFYNVYNPLKRLPINFFDDKEEDYKRDIVPEELTFSGSKFKTESMEASIWSIYDYPLDVAGGWLSHVVNSSSTTCVINIRPVSETEGKRLMDRAITEIRTQMLNRKSATQTEAERVQLESFYAIVDDISRGNEALRLVNTLVMSYAKDEKELRSVKREVRTNLRQNSLKIDTLPLRQQQGYIAMLPTPRDDIIDVNGRDMPSITLGASFPFVFQSLHDKDGFLLGYNNASLIFWDPKIRNSSRTNSNVMIIGKSGSGKSHFTKKMILKLLLEDIKIYIIDPEGEYNILTRRLGGQRIDVGAGLSSRINPFHIFGQMEEDEEDSEYSLREGLRSIFSNHVQFLEQFFENLLPDLTDKEISRLSKMIIESYNRKGITEFTEFDTLSAEQFPVMDDLLAVINERIKYLSDIIIEDSNRSVDLGDEVNDLRNLQVYVERLATGGSLATLWNGPTTIDTNTSDLIHFDFKKMSSSKNERVMNVQMMLILRFLENEVSKNRERNLARKENKYVAIMVDEAHVFIDERTPAALYFMFQMVKRIRKYNGIFVVITQNVNDFVGAENIKKYTTAIVNGCQYSFVFGLNPADLQSLMDLYHSVGGFSEEERMFIGNAGIGQCLFIVAPGQRITMQRILISKDEEKAFK